MHVYLGSHATYELEGFTLVVWCESLAILMQVVTGTDYALPKGSFVELEDACVVAWLLELLSHTDETDVASDVVQTNFVR